jgi:hypothetical protein
MNKPENLHLDARVVPDLPTAIDNWLGARDAYKFEPSDENQSDYNATLNDLGAAWNERYSQVARTRGEFDWYLSGLIAPEEDE